MKMPKDLDDWKRWVRFVVDTFKVEVLEEPKIDAITYYSVMVRTYDVIVWKGNSGSSPFRCFTLADAVKVEEVSERCHCDRRSKDFRIEIRKEHTWLNPHSAVFEGI